MVFRNRRKRLRISQPTSEEDSPEEVGEFAADHSSDSDFEKPSVQSNSHYLEPKTSSVRIRNRNDIRETQLWVERYASVPVQSGPATSSKKTKEISSWVSNALNGGSSRLLVLAGPPGCGKSSAVRLSARALRCKITEWHAPLTGARNISLTLLEDFRSFFVGGRYDGLRMDNEDADEDSFSFEHKLLLVEDLPLSASDILQKRVMLQEIFSNAAKHARHPTVVVISDSEKGIAKSGRLLLGSELLESPCVATIKVPAITNTMMRRRLRDVLAAEGLSVAKDKLEGMVSSASGDIRAALNGLQFCVSHGRQGLSITGNSEEYPIRRRNSKRRKSNPLLSVSVLGAVGQDITLGTYHAVAKILNNKRSEAGLSSYIAEDVLDDARADPQSFLAFLHHNYPEFFGDMDDVVGALDCLSDSDCLLRWRQDDLARTGLGDCAASVVTRGFLHHNSHPIRTGWRPIRGPESYAVLKEGREHSEEAQRRFSGLFSPCVYTRSMLCEEVPIAELITQSTIKQWGVLREGTVPLRVRIADAAEVAMVDFEAAQARGTNAVLPEANAAVGLPRQENIEEIEDWDD